MLTEVGTLFHLYGGMSHARAMSDDLITFELPIDHDSCLACRLLSMLAGSSSDLGVTQLDTPQWPSLKIVALLDGSKSYGTITYKGR